MRMRKRLVSFVLFILFANITLQHANADDSVYQGSGCQVYPIQNTDVQLVAETITITDDRAFGLSKRQNFGINVDMTFKNQGADTTVQMGFPISFMDKWTGDTGSQEGRRSKPRNQELTLFQGCLYICCLLQERRNKKD